MASFIGKLKMNFGKFGAAETYAMTKASIDAALTTMKAIVDRRVLMLMPDVSVVEASVSDLDVRGDSLLDDREPIAGTFANTATATYNPIQAVLYRMTDASHIHRSLKWIRFIPDENYNESGTYSPTLAWGGLATDLRDLVKAQCAIPHKISGALTPPFYTLFPVDTIKEERGTKKAIGRPFLLSVGRRPT